MAVNMAVDEAVSPVVVSDATSQGISCDFDTLGAQELTAHSDFLSLINQIFQEFQ
jgi:hypothetical protein